MGVLFSSSHNYGMRNYFMRKNLITENVCTAFEFANLYDGVLLKV